MRDALFPAGAETTHDFDLTTDARPDEIERLVRGLGRRRVDPGGPLRHHRCSTGAGSEFEITTHRAEVYVPDSRKPEVTFGDDIELDLSRRDFTINALALRLPDMELIDPFDGLGDLAAGRLRTPLDPEISFGDDPLRMLRAARFAARFNLKPDPHLEAAVEAMHDRLSIVSRERIRDELDKIVMVDVPSEALWFVVRTGLAADFLPELPGLALEQDPIHRHKDVLAHTLAVMDKTSKDRILRLAALFHDVGKPQDAGHHRRRRDLPPSRDGGGAHDPGPHDGPALLGRGHRHGGAAGRAPSAVPHLPAGLDRQGGAPLRPRCRPAARPAQRADPLRLHHPQRRQGPGPGPAHGRARGPHHRAAASRRSWAGSGPTSPATRSWNCWGWARARWSAGPWRFLMELRLDEGPLERGRGDGAPPGVVGQPTDGGQSLPKGRAS